jgi:hypothetical protein
VTKTQDQEFEGRSPKLEAGLSADGLPTSATKALSRSAIAGPQKVQTSDDEIALLLGDLTSTETKTGASAGAAATEAEVQQPLSQAHAGAASQHEVSTSGNIDSDLKQAPSRSAGQLDLTGIFRKVKAESAVPSSQTADARGRAAGEEQNTEAGLGFTQMFQSLSAPHASANHAQKAAGPADTSPRDYKAAQQLTNEISPSVQGDFTSFFQRVDASNTDVTPIEESFPFTANSNSLTESVQGGGFTQLLRALSAQQDTDLPVGVPATLRTQEIAISPSGPGEFTRIISGSMLREAQARADRQEEPRIQASMTPELQAGALAASIVPAAKQGLTPHLPAPSASSAAAPPEWVAAASTHALPSQMPFSLSHSPQASLQAGLPHSVTQVAPATAPPTDRLRQYMPLLLIANLFVMVVVLILVVFLLLHR